MTTHPPCPPDQSYAERCARYATERDRYEQLSTINANISLALVVLALIGAGVWLWRSPPAALQGALLCAAGFVASYVHHGRVDRRLARYAGLWSINNEGLLRLRRDWAALPLRAPAEAGPATRASLARARAADLDLLGQASLQHLLNRPATPVGQVALERWLLEPAAPADMLRRQAAVRELAALPDVRDELALQGQRVGAHQAGYERFLAWAGGPTWLEQRHWLLWLARLLPLTTLGLALLQLAGVLNQPLWIAGLATGLLVSLSIGRRVDALIDQVAVRQEAFRAYATLFALIAAHSWESLELQRLQRELTANGLRADQQMRHLGRLMPLADVRRWMFFLVVQIATLWNIHTLWLLERWQRAAGAQASAWLTALGEVEALAAMATLAHDHPDWVFPEICDNTEHTLYAQQLGHPLLRPRACVRNDVAIGPPGTFLLVTGSNMSGKSTLLRAIGVNITLAQAGGPVCATRFRLPPLALATSMRVQDSLEQGVSYFMAELQRLKAVVDEAERTRASGERTLLFLLDEILHGTNTAERQIAARHIIGHLLALGAAGAVSTHDLTLADEPQLAARSTPVHFSETFTRDSNKRPMMSFDYVLRPGVATSTNALTLMEIVGLSIDTPPPLIDRP